MLQNTSKLYSYVVMHDLGLAPNPFWGFCTLALCTPNHMGICPQNGDWIMGTASVSQGSKLIYAMQVAEVLSFEDYYNDSRFEKKKPSKGLWEQICGDNIYYKNSMGEWQHHQPIYFHGTEWDKKKDLRYPRVFIAKNFYYFGEKAVEIPFELQSLIYKRQGCKSNHNLDTIQNFLSWLQSNFEPGIHGQPRDRLRSVSNPIELKL